MKTVRFLERRVVKDTAKTEFKKGQVVRGMPDDSAQHWFNRGVVEFLDGEDGDLFEQNEPVVSEEGEGSSVSEGGETDAKAPADPGTQAGKSDTSDDGKAAPAPKAPSGGGKGAAGAKAAAQKPADAK